MLTRNGVILRDGISKCRAPTAADECSQSKAQLEMNKEGSLRIESGLTTVDDYINWTYHRNPQERRKALKELCPCHVRADLDQIWERILECTNDPDPLVRDQALHALGDGSPKHLELRILEIIEKMYNDKEPRVKKKARKMLNSYRRNGKWNVL